MGGDRRPRRSYDKLDRTSKITYHDSSTITNTDDGSWVSDTRGCQGLACTEGVTTVFRVQIAESSFGLLSSSRVIRSR
jgi:hypothetical protein